MAQEISQEIYKLLLNNSDYKFNIWLNTTAKNDISEIHRFVLGDDTNVEIYSINLFYALKALYTLNDELHVKEYHSFLDTIINMQTMPDDD